MKVIAADGDYLLLQIMTSYLQHHEIEARTATDGEACIELMRESPPDVLVLESDLYWKDARGAAALVRSAGGVEPVPIILITDSHHDQRHAGLTSIVARLRKPFRLADLLSHIKSADPTARPSTRRWAASAPFSTM